MLRAFWGKSWFLLSALSWVVLSGFCEATDRKRVFPLWCQYRFEIFACKDWLNGALGIEFFSCAVRSCLKVTPLRGFWALSLSLGAWANVLLSFSYCCPDSDGLGTYRVTILSRMFLLAHLYLPSGSWFSICKVESRGQKLEDIIYPVKSGGEGGCCFKNLETLHAVTIALFLNCIHAFPPVFGKSHLCVMHRSQAITFL